MLLPKTQDIMRAYSMRFDEYAHQETGKKCGHRDANAESYCLQYRLLHQEDCFWEALKVSVASQYVSIFYLNLYKNRAVQPPVVRLTLSLIVSLLPFSVKRQLWIFWLTSSSLS